jgi:hypothetical protein
MAAIVGEAKGPAKPLGKAQGRTAQIHGLGPSLALKLVGECGRDLMAWPSAKHFASWLRLAPGNKISGGKILSARTRRSSSRTTPLLRLAATTVGRTETALGAGQGRNSDSDSDSEEDGGAVLQCLAQWHEIQRSCRARRRGTSLQRIPNGEAVAWEGPTSRTPVLRAVTSRQRTIVRRNRAELKTTGPWLPCSKTTARSDQFVAYTHSTAQSGERL